MGAGNPGISVFGGIVIFCQVSGLGGILDGLSLLSIVLASVLG